MHFLCIPIVFLTVATRPVDVAAHVEASAIVSTDGRFETQRHLRIHAHDKDDDDRTFPEFDEVTSSKIFKELMEIVNPTTATSTSLKDASDTNSLNSIKRKRLVGETLEYKNKAAKKKKGRVDSFLAAARNAQKQNENTKNGEEPMIPFSKVMKPFEDSRVSRLFHDANRHLLLQNTDPKNVFELYGLQFAQNKPYEHQQLDYWATYVGMFDRKHSTKTLLLDTLAHFYDFEILLSRSFEIYNYEIKERVQAEFDNLFPANITPEESFKKFGLSEDADKLLDNKNLLFWMKYVPYFNSRNNENVLISSILDKYS